MSFAIRSEYSFLNFAVRHTVRYDKNKKYHLRKKEKEVMGDLGCQIGHGYYCRCGLYWTP
jgi:hypothetical protein